jgi:hypothetical protein
MHRGKSRLSFNHLVGAGEQSRRDNKPERFGRLQVDDELKLGDGVGKSTAHDHDKLHLDRQLDQLHR